MARAIPYSICFVVLLLWIFYLVHMEMVHLNHAAYLGGSSVLFYLLPVVSVMAVRFSEYSRILWAILFLFVIVIAVNHLHSILLHNQVVVAGSSVRNMIAAHLIVSIPPFGFAIAYIAVIMAFLDTGSISDHEDPQERFRELCGVGIYALLPFLASMLAIIPAKPMIEHLANNKYVLHVGCEYILFAFIFAIIYFVHETTKISAESINYLAKPFKKISDYGPATVKKYYIVGLSVLLLASFVLEFSFRGHWVIWGQTVALFLVGMYLTFTMGKVLFVLFPSSDDRPDILYPYLPLMMKKRKIVLFILFILMFPAAFIVLF